MERTTGRIKNDLMELDELKKKKAGDSVRLSGIIHDVRDMGEFAFVILRETSNGIVQVLISNEQHKEWQPKKADSVIVSGTVEDDDRAPDGFEIYASQLPISSSRKGHAAYRRCKMEAQILAGHTGRLASCHAAKSAPTSNI